MMLRLGITGFSVMSIGIGMLSILTLGLDGSVMIGEMNVSINGNHWNAIKQYYFSWLISLGQSLGSVPGNSSG